MYAYKLKMGLEVTFDQTNILTILWVIDYIGESN